MGHYRLGQFQQAVEILQKADSRYRATNVAGGGAPWNLAFLAMAYERLGRSSEAKATLDRLRTCMKHPRWSADGFYQAMLREAEAEIPAQHTDSH